MHCLKDFKDESINGSKRPPHLYYIFIGKQLVIWQTYKVIFSVVTAY